MLNIKKVSEVMRDHYFSMTGDENIRDPFVTDVIIRAHSEIVDDAVFDRLKEFLSEKGFSYVKNLIQAHYTGNMMSILEATNTSYR